MKVLDIAAAMGIATAPLPKGTGVREQFGEKFYRKDFLTPQGWLVVGNNPTTVAALMGKCDSTDEDVCIFYDPDQAPKKLADPILHEVCHAVCGKLGFVDEGDSGLMALQWALLQELEGDEYRGAREDFASYGLTGNYCGDDSDAIGTGPGFQRSRAWKAVWRAAIEHGLILPDGRVVWGCGPAIGAMALTRVRPRFGADDEPSLYVTA